MEQELLASADVAAFKVQIRQKPAQGNDLLFPSFTFVDEKPSQ